LVQEKSNKSEAAQAALLGFISENHPEDSGIIYCWTRTHCDNLVSFLRSEKFSAQSYHSGIGNTQREKVQKAWLAGSTKIVVATVIRLPYSRLNASADFIHQDGIWNGY